MGVAEWFSDFCGALRIKNEQRTSFAYRTSRITKAVNTWFRGIDNDSAYRFYVGSMGRGTAIPSVSDVDLLVELPASVYDQYNGYAGNKQSSFLSAVRSAIQTTYPNSSVSGDGQVVVINFSDNVTYEVLPAFLGNKGGYVFADSNNGGSWKSCWPKQEISAFAQRDASCNKNLVELSRMARAWRDTNNVPMNGMLIDTLAYQFINTWAHRQKSFLYYDFLTRDFFSYLASQNPQQSYWLAPGSNSYVWRKGSFEYKARQAELRAIEAIAHQMADENWSAKQKYRGRIQI